MHFKSIRQKREYQREWKRARRAAAIAYLGGACRACGKTEELQFDHIYRDTKARRITDLLTGRWDKLIAELAKCQLLCGDDHEFKTVNEEDLDEVPF